MAGGGHSALVRRKYHFVLAKTAAVLLCLAAWSAGAAIAPTNAPPMRIVTCEEGTDLDAVIAEFNLQPKFIYRPLFGFAAPMDAATVDRLKARRGVLFVEDDGPMVLAGQTNPSGVVRMGVPEFAVARINTVPKVPIDVDVAVIDTGIDLHPDLNIHHAISMIDDNVSDQSGHGTLVAGVLGARDNGFGVVGVAPGVRLWNIKAVSPADNSWSNVAAAFSYVLERSNVISVVNLSLVSDGNCCVPMGALRLGVQRLVNAGIVFVAASGNFTNDLASADGMYGTGDDYVPAAFPFVMAVSAMSPDTDTLWHASAFSQIERTNNAYAGVSNVVVSPGGAIDVAAPGVNILSTAGIVNVGTNAGYLARSGTSLAAPHVAGLVALYIAANGRATNAAGVARIRQAIIDASLPQSQWNTTNTLDPDTNPEPLAIASEAWIPKPVITHYGGTPGAFQVGFATVPGYDYTVQSTADLTPPAAWTNVAQVSSSNVVTAASVTDASVAERSFYRLARRSALELPAVISQPQNLRVPVGSNATLNVSAVGLPALGFQWYRDGLPLGDGGNVSGANAASLVVANVSPAEAGNYHVWITNQFGSATSVVATLTVLTNWTATNVTGVLATATSELAGFGRYASNTVNGATSPGAIWQTVGVAQPQGNDPEPAITFDLGAVRALERAQIWTGPEPGPAARRFTVLGSDDGLAFHALGEFTLTTLSPASESISLGGVVTRYVRLVFQENGNGQIFPAGYAPMDANGYLQLDEVEFHEYSGD